MITINCCVCGKEYQIGSNELNRLWCSVGCQYGQTCSFCDGKCCLDELGNRIDHSLDATHDCDYCDDGTDKGL